MRANAAPDLPGMTQPPLMLDGSDAAWFGDWLRDGILAYELGIFVDGYEPFKGARHLFDGHGQLVDNLVDVYDRLAPHQQTLFTHGLAHAMRRLDLSQRRDHILARRLLAIAQKVTALDAIRILARLIDPARDDEMTTGLVSATVEAMARRPSIDDRMARDALVALAHSKAFGPLQARRALPALCKADPKGLIHHLRLLHPHLQARYGPMRCLPPGSARWMERGRRMQEILTSVTDPPVIARAFEDWPARVPQGLTADNKAQRNDWFCASLDDPEIARRVAPLRRPAVPLPSPPRISDPTAATAADPDSASLAKRPNVLADTYSDAADAAYAERVLGYGEQSREAA